MALVDTHCHLNFNTFSNDIEKVIARAEQAGVKAIIVPGIDLESSLEAIKLARKYPILYAAVGIHPNSSKEWNDNSLDELTTLSKHPKVVAIGEIGLDYYRDHSPRLTQKEAFEKQLRLSQKLCLPVIIHNRDASEDLWSILDNWTSTLTDKDHALKFAPGVLHSYDPEQALTQQAIRANFYFGISGPVTFSNAITRQQKIANLPMEHILLETDAPFLTPHPFRGKRNEPAYIEYINDKISTIFNLSPSSVAKMTTQNAERVFNIQ